MCGICGFANRSGLENEAVKSLRDMNQALVHRGPDQDNVYVRENFAFGFRRLSIIGMNNGSQPIASEDESIVMMCNGEIFNYQTLKKGLLAKGHRFRTETDVEVILHLYEEYGAGFLEWIEGQFSIALYDFKNNSLLLARDHFGILPMFYTLINGTLVFASEIKSILCYPGVTRSVDLTGLDQVMTLPGLVSPRTMFQGISSLPPGQYLLFENNIQLKEYWDIHYPKMDDVVLDYSEEECAQRLQELIVASVKKRLMSEVPIGTYLSGGLDSSLITSIVNQLSDERITALSMTFDDAFFNEESYQQIVADHLGITSMKTKFDGNRIADNLWRVISHCECPIKETYNTATIQLSAMAKSHGIKVILTGEGADELFAGYPSYQFDAHRSLHALNNISLEEQEIRGFLWGISDYFYEKDFSVFQTVKERMYSSKLRSEYHKFAVTKHPLIDKSKIQGIEKLHIRSYLDMKLRIADHLLSDHGDRMLMANSVEGRYPFLDKDLVEFVTQIPIKYKLKGYCEKYILKQVGSHFLPKQIVQREKFGFSAPGSPQLLQQKIDWIEDLLHPDKIARQGYFNPQEIKRLTALYRTPGFMLNIPYEEDLLMPVLSFGIFKDVFGLPDL